MNVTKAQMKNLKRVWTSRIAFDLNHAQAKHTGFGYMHLNPRHQLVDLGLARVMVALDKTHGRIRVLVLTDLGRAQLGV